MITLANTQKVRVKQLKDMGLRLGSDFEVHEAGVLLISTGEIYAWNEIKDKLPEIEEYKEVFGLGQPVEHDAETKAALKEAEALEVEYSNGLFNPVISHLADTEINRLGLNDHIGSAGEDLGIMEELVAVQLAAQIAPLIQAIVEEPEVVMEPEAAREEPLFIITNTGATGVALSKRLRQEIAERVREVFESQPGAELAKLCRMHYELEFGTTLDGKRAAYACQQYAKAVVRSLTRQTGKLKVNSYWA